VTEISYQRPEDLDRFYTLVDSINQIPTREPVHVAVPDASMWYISSTEDWNKMSSLEAQNVFQKQHIFLTGFSDSHVFDKKGLSTVTRPERIIVVEGNGLVESGKESHPLSTDFSQPPKHRESPECRKDPKCSESPKCKHSHVDIRADMMLQYAKTGPPLRSQLLQMPLPHVDPPLALATDIRAWRNTMGMSLCKPSPFPTNGRRMGFISNANTLGSWKTTGEGMCALINVVAGEQWCIVSRQAALGEYDQFLNLFAHEEEYKTEGMLIREGCAM
jgi:hypothetical protein